MAEVSELAAAYQLLDVPIGANEDAVRDARKTLAKVWHPDRYASDPALQQKAQIKLREINEAFERVKAAGFPAAAPPVAPPPPATPSAPTARAPMAIPTFRQSDVTYVPKRSSVWVGILVATAVVAGGGVVAVVVLGVNAPAKQPPTRVLLPAPPTTPTTPTTRAAGATFTLGSTHDEVRAAQGAPNAVRTVITEDWTYGFSSVAFDGGKVVGWRTADMALHTRIDPRDRDRFAAARARGTVAIGSTMDEVAAVDGPPTSVDHVIHDAWSYGFSTIEFDDAGKVIEYAERDVPLHVK